MATKPMITESNALELAKAELSKKGLKVGDYDMAVKTDPSGNEWLVWFNRKVAVVGDIYVVTVEKATGKVQFTPVD